MILAVGHKQTNEGITMKVKIGTIVSTAEPITRLMTEKMAISVAFKLKQTLALLQEQIKTYDETRVELINKHGKDGEIKPESKNFNKFVNEMEELLATEVKLDVEKISQSDLNKIEITPADLMALEWLIEE